MNVFETIPIVDPWKVIEHRHITQICNRWATDHMTDLLRAFFNGDGFVPWGASAARADARARCPCAYFPGT